MIIVSLSKSTKYTCGIIPPHVFSAVTSENEIFNEKQKHTEMNMKSSCVSDRKELHVLLTVA